MLVSVDDTRSLLVHEVTKFVPTKLEPFQQLINLLNTSSKTESKIFLV